MERAKNLRGTNAFLNENYSENCAAEARELIPAMEETRDRGDIAYSTSVTTGSLSTLPPKSLKGVRGPI